MIPWRRERLPTPVFWPGEFHRLYSPWGLAEADTTVAFTSLGVRMQHVNFEGDTNTQIIADNSADAERSDRVRKTVEWM